MPTLTYRFMTAADLDAVGALARRIWDAHYPGIITQAQIDYMFPLGYAPQALARQMAEGQRFLLVETADNIVGFMSTGPLAAITNPILRGEAVGDGSYFLHKCYFAPELHGQNIAAQAFAELLARLGDVRHMRLQVHRNNRKGWRFYEKLGFTIECEADFDIGGGFAMTDYVMEWRA